jgi:cell division protein FtsB
LKTLAPRNSAFLQEFPSIKAVLSRQRHSAAMVTRPRLRSVLTALGLYVAAGMLIGYFGVNAFTGNHGLNARQNIDQQIAELSAELAAVKGERAVWERRVSLLKSESLDPDLLDERARALLDYVDGNDLTLMLKRP